jgi:hypothetical protein
VVLTATTLLLAEVRRASPRHRPGGDPKLRQVVNVWMLHPEAAKCLAGDLPEQEQKVVWTIHYEEAAAGAKRNVSQPIQNGSLAEKEDSHDAAN